MLESFSVSMNYANFYFALRFLGKFSVHICSAYYASSSVRCIIKDRDRSLTNLCETDVYHLNFPEDLNYIKAFGSSNIHLSSLLTVNLH